MSLIQWSNNPFREMEAMMKRLPSVVGMQTPGQFMPAVDIYEDKNGKNLIISTPVAGVSPKDVEVSVDSGVLTIQGKSHKQHEMEEKNYYHKEIRSGSFFRQIALPVSVKEDKVKASIENGMLTIECPKEKAQKKKKKIDVKVIKGGKKKTK